MKYPDTHLGHSYGASVPSSEEMGLFKKEKNSQHKELARYEADKVPEICPECDSRDFISSGSKHFICLHCWDVETIDKMGTQIEKIEKLLPSTYHAGKELSFRISLMVDEWRRLVVANQQLENQIKEIQKREFDEI